MVPIRARKVQSPGRCRLRLLIPYDWTRGPFRSRPLTSSLLGGLGPRIRTRVSAAREAAFFASLGLCGGVGPACLRAWPEWSRRRPCLPDHSTRRNPARRTIAVLFFRAKTRQSPASSTLPWLARRCCSFFFSSFLSCIFDPETEGHLERLRRAADPLPVVPIRCGVVP